MSPSQLYDILMDMINKNPEDTAVLMAEILEIALSNKSEDVGLTTEENDLWRATSFYVSSKKER